MIPGGIKTNERELIGQVTEWVEACRVSVGPRAAYYRLLNALAETGRYDGLKALINTLHVHLDRTAAHLFSPVGLKFDVDFELTHPAEVYERAKVAAKVVTRHWDRTNTDIVFGRGVFESLKYGAALLKQWTTTEQEHPVYHRKLVMPWNFGVYREDENDIDKQEILCETTSLTMAEVWQRIWHFADAEKLYRKIKANSRAGGKSEGAAPTNFFHQVLSTSQLQTGVTSGTLPGGLVQIANDPNYSIMGPVVAADQVEFHELWVKDEEDYTTIQFIPPDILIAPHTMKVKDDTIVTRKQNLLIQGSRMQPYRLIQPNESTNWFWGRSELIDLVEPQMLLATWADDTRRLFGLQIDKILAISGYPGLTDELYDQFRAAGYIGMPQGAAATDLTPKIPPELLPMLKWLLETINWLGSFPPVMQGQGEPGVRAQAHASTLIKTASPTLRDRALLVERQAAQSGDLTLSMMEAKDDRHYHTQADKIEDAEKTAFLLADLPEDWRITVDSHSSSPIFADENQQLIFAAFKVGAVDAEYVLDNLPELPDRESAKVRLRARIQKNAEQFQQFIKQHPEAETKLLEHQFMSRKKSA